MTDYPPMSDQAKNMMELAIKMAKQAVNGGPIKVPAETKQERLKICEECPSFEPHERRCKECGCYMELKASFTDSSCPLEKW